MDSQLGMAQLILAELPPALWYSAFTGRAENIRFPFLREICFSSCSLFFFFSPNICERRGCSVQELISFEEMSRQVDMKGEAWQCLEGYPFLAGGVGCGS